MKFYNLLIKYRLYIGIVLVLLGIYVNFSASFWPAFPLYLVGVILIAGHFFFGPLRLIQEHLEGGNIEGAEKMMKKGLDLGMPMKEAEGASMLQMGMLLMQKNDLKQAESYIRQALRKGLPDKENESAAYLQMCSIMMNKREFRAAKDFFRKAKALKPTTPQIVDQIKQIEKYITRIPG